MKICVNGKMREMTAEELAEYEERMQSTEHLEAQADHIRLLRTEMLKETDWTQVPDAPVDQNAWRTYRQELRDITLQEGFPSAIVWPTPPE